jgi:glycosyltransferase involved in cell wall biosynthesis
LRDAHAVQVLDKRHGQFLRRLRVQTPVIEAPNGYFPAEVPAESTLNTRDSGEPRLVFMGRLDAYNKGLDLLLKAFSQLSETVAATLAIRGPDHGDRARLKAQAAELGILHKVEFPGTDFTRTSPQILSDYDIFCLPSRFEGFGLAALEAMIAARPVLVSDVAGIAPHVRQSNCGVVVTPDVASIEAGLRKLLDSRKDWNNYGLRGRNYALENLEWRAIAASALDQTAQLTN